MFSWILVLRYILKQIITYPSTWNSGAAYSLVQQMEQYCLLKLKVSTLINLFCRTRIQVGAHVPYLLNCRNSYFLSKLPVVMALYRAVSLAHEDAHPGFEWPTTSYSYLICQLKTARQISKVWLTPWLPIWNVDETAKDIFFGMRTYKLYLLFIN